MRFTKKSDSAVNDDLSWYDAEYKAQNCVTNRLRRHDSIFSVESNYEYGSANDLNMWEGAILLTADCLGTGILALPQGIHILGTWLGVGFLIVNLPINFYAGKILSDSALFVENRQGFENEEYDGMARTIDECSDVFGKADGREEDRLLQGNIKDGVNSYMKDPNEVRKESRHHLSLHHDTATFDFTGMASDLFDKQAARFVMILFYTNVFLTLGDYILVMSHAVAALLGESWICIPQAGVLASTLMFAVSQIRTMAKLGRCASIVSLIALFVVVLQCLYFANHVDSDIRSSEDVKDFSDSTEFSILRKLSAMGSIGFAVGSQKLLLNIRHELADRNTAPKSLAISLSAYGAFYVAIVLCAGPSKYILVILVVVNICQVELINAFLFVDPPGLLFDAIPSGVNRRLAGLLLWIHVVVSYAINSQAICASMDRIFFYQWGPVRRFKDHHRWMILTGIMSISAFFVANAIPFFKDLVAFIGAITSVPLTL